MIETSIREYIEEYPIKIFLNEKGRYVIESTNEGGYNSVNIDLLDVVNFYKNNEKKFFEK